MLQLILAAAFFTGIHFGISGTRYRDVLVARFGEKAFQAGFSILSLAGLVWLIRAYGQAPYIETWGTVAWFKPVVAALMPVAFILLVFSVASPNATAVGGEKLLAEPGAARSIFRITRHPMLWGVSLWALLHLIVNGDLAALVLFGSLLALTLLGTRSIDNKRRRSGAAGWEAFAAATSNIPFAAIREGRNHFDWRELANWRLALGIVLALAIMHFHARWFGVSPLW